ncbi:PLP-dependent aminotransferase family protein [Massilia sp. CCM 9210]|uniref:MocR-like pyridoxine biosynthesis transcription factor PdxR n=1 Tax=Massilia scottii TaxID=3057166 RepID=UPI0027968A8F|nr:PLP-dependent aminotransferase family protein [Massilia sp. CCM 9210]MDQ1814492.1 PLP-dependent aminotransferase family protein [Massilia sp. CCM 9210]
MKTNHRTAMLVTDILAALPLARGTPDPLFRQLYAQIKEAILRGTLSAGMQLPPTRELARLLAVSRQTVLNAYDQLSAEGYLHGAVGKGTFISDHLAQAAPGPDATHAPMRPLSARGDAYATAMESVGFHQGKLRPFRVSMPSLDLFPFDVWSRLKGRRWRHPDHHMGYSDPAGYAPLRELLCVYLRASRGVTCTPEQVIVTSGSQQGLFLLSQLLLDPGDRVWVESPGYQGASAPLFAAGANVCTVPVSADGMDVAYGMAHYPDAKMVLATPSHQLPLGVTMSLQRRLELLRWATAKRAWIIEDDYDSEYRYTGPPLASLQSLDRAGCVLYVGTLSKVLFPGLRLGYIVAPPALVEPVVRAKAVMDRHTAIVPQMVLADFMADGHFGRHIRRTRDAYAERRAALLAAIEARMGEQVTVGPSDAGLDLAVHFRRGHDEATVVARALEQGIETRALDYYVNRMATPACAFAPGLLLGFSSLTTAQIVHGIDVLATVLAKVPKRAP